MADRQRSAIIEFAGLPGAGKSTIARGLRPLLPEVLGPQLPPASRRASPRLYAAVLSLGLSLRPLQLNDLHRCLKIIEGYNIYRHGLGAPLLLEQGLIQRLWSAAADRAAYDPVRLEGLVRLLAAAPPDVIVWVRTAPESAAARILTRPHGNSRYERMEERDMVKRLGSADRLYENLIGLYRRHSSAAILELSGEDPVCGNVARVAAFVKAQLPRLEVSDP
jgi:hypothetical protein